MVNLDHDNLWTSDQPWHMNVLSIAVPKGNVTDTTDTTLVEEFRSSSRSSTNYDYRHFGYEYNIGTE